MRIPRGVRPGRGWRLGKWLTTPIGDRSPDVHLQGPAGFGRVSSVTTVPNAVSRLLPGILALASVALMVVAAVVLPWASLPGGSSGALTSNLPWLFGGSDLVAGVSGTFANGWLLVGLGWPCSWLDRR